MTKQAKKLENILNHVTAHDKDTQAMLVAKVVDHNGPEFAAEVTKKNQKKYRVG